MNGKSLYWIIPLIFAVIFTEMGYVIWTYIPILTINIDGNVFYAFPPHYLTYYNSVHGPFSSTFLSNFIWDGWGNLQVLFVYVAVFSLTNVSVPRRLSRAWFSVIGALAAALISGAISRYVLPSNVVGYGQSAVAAGFAGIVLFFLIQNIASREGRQRAFGVTIDGAVYVFAAIVGLGFVMVFFVEPRNTVIVHFIALSAGIILAGAYSYMTRSTKREKTAYLISESKVRA